jgi:hypothetical protein
LNRNVLRGGGSLVKNASRYRRRVLAKLVASPWVAVPVGLGAVSLLASLALGEPRGFLAFMGMSGILLGVGMALTRWLYGLEDLAREALDDLDGETEESHRAYLNQLETRLRADGDPRTDRSLTELRNLRDRMTGAGLTDESLSSAFVPEIREKAEQLYHSCLASLERTLELWRAAQEMATEKARTLVLDSRESLLGEVAASIRHLGATLDHLRTAELRRDRGDQSLARMREELEMGLEVARRVDQRVGELDESLRQRLDGRGEDSRC